MPGLRKQRQRVRAQSGHKGDNDVGERSNQRKAEDGLGLACAWRGRRGVDMHKL